MAEDLTLIEKNIKKIFEEANKYPEANVMAAIKTRSDAEIRKAYDCGIRFFGENRVQELLEHYECVSSLKDAKLHMIGTLQTNKVKYIIDKVDMIESLDTLSLAKEINKRASAKNIKMKVLVEVNIGREEQKGGVMPEDLPAFLESLKEFENITPKGLMTIAPVKENPKDYDVYFSEIVSLRDNLFRKVFPNAEKPIVSMGMSGNYKEALLFGSNMVRLGTEIFGPRPQKSGDLQNLLNQ